MLIQEKLEKLKDLSSSEQAAARYILSERHRIRDMTVGEIARQTHTSPSTTVRLAQKIGYEGWGQLRAALFEELQYLESHFQEIDPNLPFSSHDSYYKISQQIARLLSDAIADTAQLIAYDSLEQAVRMLAKAQIIYLFAITNTASACYDFAYKMRYISKRVIVVENPEEFVFTLNMCRTDDCCIFISYSGETFDIFHLTPILKKRRFPAVSITSIGENSLLDVTDCHLYLSTREKLYSKIGHYVSNESIHYLLDVLYSGVFRADYQKNWEKKLALSRELDKDRHSSVSVLQETGAP